MDKENDHLPYAWLPYAVAVMGILLSIAAWFILVNRALSPEAIRVIEDSYPWILLILCILLAALIGVALRLAQVTDQRKLLYEIMKEEFKNEIAERMHAEETKQKLEKALLQGQKLQAIGTLAGGIAHDFNNLLYAIIGYVEMAREDVAKESLVYSNLGKVLAASKRGQELVARILGFSRRQHHDLKPICINETIEGVLGLLRPTIPASVTIRFQPMPHDCKILGNQTQLHQVMVNIINNAVDAMDGEGQVTIELTLIQPTDPLLKQFLKIAEGNYCKIDITDTGHGMDQTTIGRIFEPFYTTKEVGKGTGLGLSTVHSIIQEHQSEILVESQLGHGSRFTLLLPVYENSKEN